MLSNECLLTDEDKTALTSCLNKTLKYIEGRDLSNPFGKNYPMLSEAARLAFTDGSIVELHCDYVTVNMTEDFWDDTGAFSVLASESPIWLPEGEKLTKVSIGKTINGIVLVNDYDKLSEGDRLVSTFAFTNAIVLDLSDEYLVFSMDYVAEDVINVNRGPELEALLPENMGSWYEKPGWNDEFHRELVKIK